MKKILLAFVFLPFFTTAQNKMIRAKGKAETIQKTLESFSKLDVNLNADIEIEIGGMPMIQLTGYPNIIDKISTQVKNNTLQLKTKDGFWLQNSKPKIKIAVPFLTSISTDGLQTGIGQISIKGIDVRDFEVNQVYGEIILQGKTTNLDINSSNRNYYKKNGTLDAMQLNTESVKAQIQGSNKASVMAKKKLTVKLLNDAELIYVGDPEIYKISGDAKRIESNKLIAKNEPKEKNKGTATVEKLNYVSVKILNNTPLRRQFVITGPNGRGGNFSYGFPLNPFQVKSEKIPVGTSFYTEASGLKGKKLVEIAEKDEGKTVKLFNNSK